MARFRKSPLSPQKSESVAQKQAVKVMARMQGRDNPIKSIGTARGYTNCLKKVARYVNQQFNISLRELTPEQAKQYLDVRSEEVGQKTLDQERQAIQAMMLNVTKALDISDKKDRLSFIKSAKDEIEKSRAYTNQQVSMIASAQSEKHALATQISYAAGLRAHELYTLKPLEHREVEYRQEREETKNTLFNARNGMRYTVVGKGGLEREVLIPVHLVEKLESRRFAEPQKVKDRGIFYRSHYNIGGGNNWSSSFSAASKRTLFRSSGAHGVRHSYAQERMRELQRVGLSRSLAYKTVSHELGHLREAITAVYLR
ncbi:integrase [Alteromonas naphthalenivorans]|uniref:Integrase n=2 Tax=Alteromonas naphthalenivorans TaxID=715451 RepID=F5Z5H8_ALTNA|nr:integrase [Alteromonas naphthalenivorans]